MKRLLLSAVMLSSIGAYAQVGVNTTDPKASFEVAYDDSQGKKVQAIGLPQVTTAQRDNFENGDLKKGQLIYNTTKDCVEVYTGSSWTCTGSSQESGVSKVVVSSVKFTGEYISGEATNNTNKVEVTLKNNGLYEIKSANFLDALTLENSGDGNVTVSGGNNINNVTLGSGQSVKLTYNLSGQPKAGPLKAIFSKFGLEGSDTRNVGQGIATIADIEDYIVSFLYTESGANVDIQGELPNEYEIKIPYAAGARGSYEGFTTEEIVTAQGESGATKKVKLVIPNVTFNNSGGFINAKVLVTDGSTYDVKKETVPGHTTPIVTFADLEIGGSRFNVELKALGGIPDKKFNTSADHKFVYLPVRVTGTVDGQSYDETWLNFNLGADYANLNKKDERIFNPAKVVTSKTDHHAYGSLFQWGRDSDGHELINWSGPNSGTRAKNVTWYSYGDSRLSYSPEKDPCPNGYHTPTKAEWQKFYKLITGTDSPISSSKMWEERKLVLPAVGYRNDSSGTSFGNTGSYGFYWSSSNDTSGNAWFMYFGSSYSSPQISNYRSHGFSVRCLKKK